MLTAAIITAVCSTLLELYIAYKWQLYKRLCTQSWLLGLAGSFALSWAIGLMFAASGVTLFMAGLFSTILSQICFMIWDAVDKTRAAMRDIRNRKSRKSTPPTPALPAPVARKRFGIPHITLVRS